MKPTEEQIRAEAEKRHLFKTFSDVFIEGAKWALSQDFTIEKVKELRGKCQIMQKEAFAGISLGEDNMSEEDWCTLIERERRLHNFIEQLNAIIE